MSSELLKTILEVLLGLAALLALVLIMFTSLGLLGEAEASEITKPAIEKISGFVHTSGDVDVLCEYEKESDYYKYYVDIEARIISGKDYDGMDDGVFTSIQFKEDRVTDQDYDPEHPESSPGRFTISKNQITPINGNYVIISDEPPMKRTDSISEILEPEQKILIKNFLVEFKDFIQVRPGAVNLPNLIKGPCTTYLGVECKGNAGKSSFLYLKEDKKTCAEQEEEYKRNCEKTFSMCDGEITIRLDEFKAEDEECPLKKPYFTIDAPLPAEEWEWGEEILWAIWRVPQEEPQQDCWSRSLKGLNPIDDTCLKQQLGVYSIVVHECTPR